jgi:UDP-glucose 4-epimerase
MKKHYLITGGLGLIGSELANQLTEPTIIISRSKTNKERLKRRDVRIIHKDIAAITLQDLTGIDIIYHLASTVDNYNVLTDPYIDMETNIRGTIHLLELCKRMSKKQTFIYPSTFFVYGNQYEKQHKPITEESPTDPLALYPATKLCAESAIKLYGKLYHIPYLICRLTNVYGENESYINKKKGALNYLIMQAVKGEPIAVYRGGNFYRDYIHVEDVVSAFRFLESHTINDLFLIGFGKPVLFKDIINYIHELTGKRSTLTKMEPPPFHDIVGIRNFVSNTGKIESLGWRASISQREGILRVVKKYQSLQLF